MAEQPEKDEKTEAPTDKRRREARGRGELFQSRELGTALLGLAGAAWLAAGAGTLGPTFAALMRDGLILHDPGVPALERLATLLAPLAAPLAGLAALALAAVLAGKALTGALRVTPSLITPKASRLNPLAGLGRMFGLHGLGELAKALLKGALLLGLGAVLVWRAVPDLLAASGASDPAAALTPLAHHAPLLLLALGGALVVIAGADLPIEFVRWLTRLRMTRQEVKDELKSSEGHPEVRAAIRRAQFASLRRSLAGGVQGSSVVVVNPLSFAVALRYRPERDAAPVVAASGRGPAADAIRSLAAEHDVPVLCYPAVARALYFTSRVGEPIRAELFGAVAIIIAFVLSKQAQLAGVEPPTAEPPPDLLFDAHGRRTAGL